MKRTAIILALALLASGCSSRYEVQSDTSWSGFVDDHSVTGSGSATFSARPSSGASFSKSTEAGTLRARATGWHGDGQWASTSAPYGTVTVSTN